MTEALDRNKSQLTHVATATAAFWLANIGCKPIESEVPLPNGTIADLAAVWTPTPTEAKLSRLLKDLVPDSVKTEQINQLQWVFRRVAGRITIAVEIKVSKSDFARDLGKKYARSFRERPSLRPCTHFLIVAAPQSVISKSETLDCGVLSLSEDCSRVIKWRGPWHENAVFPGDIEDVIAAIAVRQHNVKAYANLRRALKGYRASRAGANA